VPQRERNRSKEVRGNPLLVVQASEGHRKTHRKSLRTKERSIMSKVIKISKLSQEVRINPRIDI
jgi:hypothetical protein